MNLFTTIRRIAAALLSEHTPDDDVGAVAEAYATRVSREIARLAKAEAFGLDHDLYEHIPFEDLRVGDYVYAAPSGEPAQRGYVAGVTSIDEGCIASVPASWERLSGNYEFRMRTADVRQVGIMRLLARAKPKGST